MTFCVPTTFVRRRAFECGIEGDVAGAVNNDIDILGDRLSFFFAISEVGLADVAARDDDFIAE